MSCQNCGKTPADRRAAARAFKSGVGTPKGTVWSVCAGCRTAANAAARYAIANFQDWEGTV